MTPTLPQLLRTTAEKANSDGSFDDSGDEFDFYEFASPANVLRLLDAYEAMKGALENILDCVENHGGNDMVVKPNKEDFGAQLLMTDLIRNALAKAREAEG